MRGQRVDIAAQKAWLLRRKEERKLSLERTADFRRMCSGGAAGGEGLRLAGGWWWHLPVDVFIAASTHVCTVCTVCRVCEQ